MGNSLQILADELAGNDSNEEQIHEEQQVEVTETVKVEQQAESKTISFEEVRAALANKARAGFTAEVKALTEQYKAEGLSDDDAKAKAEQMTCIDKARLIHKIGQLTPEFMQRLERRIKKNLDIK